MTESSELSIRRAGPADADAVASLVTQLGYPVAAAEIPGRLERFAADPRAVVLLAEHEGRAVGLATIHVLTVINRDRDVAWLTSLVVDEGARGLGVGRRMVLEVEAFARNAGCEWLSVTTQTDREGARAFYPRIGMRETGRRFGKDLRP